MLCTFLVEKETQSSKNIAVSGVLQFGVVQEHGIKKAFGAGILSSFGEMENMTSVRLNLKRPSVIRNII